MAAFNGTAQGDLFEGNAESDIVNGLGGNDTLNGFVGNDTIYGGGGNDLITAGDGADFLVGGRGSDVLFAVFGFLNSADAPDTVSYNDEAGGTRGVTVNLITGIATDSFGFTDYLVDVEAVRGTRFNDRLTGGNSANNSFESFMGLRGADRIDGGSGFDEVRYDLDAQNGGTAGISVNLQRGRIVDGFGNTDIVAGIELVRATAQNDVLVGNDFNNEFMGLAGDDRINGRAGSDWIRYDADAENGGLSGVVVNLANSNGRDGFGDNDTLTSIENVTATQFADRVTGSAEGNTLQLEGGNDSADGGDGADAIYGGLGNDRLAGGAGSDFIAGGFGTDRLTGNAGFDSFFFNEIAEAGDVITDFFAPEDVLSFNDIFFLKGNTQSLVLGVDFFYSTTSTGAVGTNASFIYETDAGRVWFDVDGSGGFASVLIATLSGRPVITVADFDFF